MYQKLLACIECIRKKTDFVPKAAIVLGSGLGGYVDNVDIAAIVEYKDIIGFPISTVSGHNGRFVFGYTGGIPIVIMQGRVHYYEGYKMAEVVLPVRVMGLLGAKTLILTNAAGGINPDFHGGDLMLITDHISSFVPSPLVGKNIDELGTRFPDMSEVYSKRLQTIAKKAAKEQGISLKSGVYIQLSGPNYETPAEIRMCKALGADAVGMSTACEAMAAAHMGLEVCGISCITNMAAGICEEKLSHEDVRKSAYKASANMKTLINAIIEKISAISAYQ